MKFSWGVLKLRRNFAQNICEKLLVQMEQTLKMFQVGQREDLVHPKTS